MLPPGRRPRKAWEWISSFHSVGARAGRRCDHRTTPLPPRRSFQKAFRRSPCAVVIDRDAEAIAKAATHPTMRSVALRSKAQLDAQTYTESATNSWGSARG